ncbi:MAG: hypothetical protein VX906_05080 [Candidatus Thermoplasmatota archaeon]|nr:hypothetical protein [Candidatus Thermoplasmatota archaeon]
MPRLLPWVVIALVLSISPTQMTLTSMTFRGTESIVHQANVTAWTVGDTWSYDIRLDAVSLVEDSPDLSGSSLEILDGTATIEVASVTLYNISGDMVPAYRLELHAEATGDGRFPEPNTGIFATGELLVDYHETRWVRVSDLAIIYRIQSLDLDFDAFGIWTTGIADFDHAHEYNPPQEIHDFPLRLNETWNSVSEHTQTWTGDGGPVAFPEPPTQVTEDVIIYSIPEVGQSPAVYPGCEDSYRIWWNNTNGDLIEDHWWCPAVRYDVHWWTDDIALSGVDGEFWLTSYSPVESTILNVTLSSEISALNSEINVSITGPSGESGTIWYHENMFNFTLLDGMATVSIPVGNRMDDTPTSIDWATHGIVACIDTEGTAMTCSVSTLTLEGSAIGGLLRQDVIDRTPLILDVGHETAQRLGLSFRF